MHTLESISASLHAAEDIQSIVRMMKSLSAASIHQYERAAMAMSQYAATVEQGLQVVLRAQEGGWLAGAQAAGGRAGVIVIGSDRGLCGRFNDRIAGFAGAQLLTERKAGGHRPLLCVLGLRTAARLSAAGHEPDRILTLPGTAAGLVQCAQSVIVQIDRWSRHDGVGVVDLAHNRRLRGAQGAPVRQRLMPVAQDYLHRLAQAPWPSRSLPMFRMEPEALLSWLISQHIFVMIYRALAESLASEHAARLAAMQGAERNIGERREDLLASYRQSRQESITRELLDVLAGFEAARTMEGGTLEGGTGRS